MKRLFLILLAALILSAVLTSCSDKKSKSEDTDTTAPVSETESTDTTDDTEEDTLPLADPADFLGCWKYTNGEEWIAIYDNGIYEVYDVIEVLIENREYQVTVDGLYLPEQGGITLSFDENGTLVDNEGHTFYEDICIHYEKYLEENSAE